MTIPTIEQSIDLVKSKIWWTRKGTDDIPNYEHSLRVYKSLKKHGFDENTQMAWLLHDIIEDGWMSLEELRELGYSDNTLRLVDLSTHDNLVEDKFERRQKMLVRLIQENDKEAWAIKLADISDNLTECHLMPKPEKKEIFLNKKCPVFIYYGNKYFWGTQFYNEFLERYFEQMKVYNQYFYNEDDELNIEASPVITKYMKWWNASSIDRLFSLANSLTEDPYAWSGDYKCLFYKWLSFNYSALSELDMVISNQSDIKEKLTGLINALAEHNQATIPESK